MGRHSAADDDVDDVDLGIAAAALDPPSPRGRHAYPTDADERRPDGLLLPSRPDRETAPAPEPTGTRADLMLLRRDPGLRARCIGALLGAFVLYSVVIAVVGRSDLYLRWIWIPIVLSGVLVGALLDLAHRRRNPPDTDVRRS
jgi:hypothetical protein